MSCPAVGPVCGDDGDDGGNEDAFLPAVLEHIEETGIMLLAEVMLKAVLAAIVGARSSNSFHTMTPKRSNPRVSGKFARY
jgi:hypothetical protein